MRDISPYLPPSRGPDAEGRPVYSGERKATRIQRNYSHSSVSQVESEPPRLPTSPHISPSPSPSLLLSPPLSRRVDRGTPADEAGRQGQADHPVRHSVRRARLPARHPAEGHPHLPGGAARGCLMITGTREWWWWGVKFVAGWMHFLTICCVSYMRRGC